MHVPSPSPADSTAGAREADGAAARAALEQLAAALGSRDFATTLVTRQGRRPLPQRRQPLREAGRGHLR